MSLMPYIAPYFAPTVHTLQPCISVACFIPVSLDCTSMNVLIKVVRY